MSKQEKRPKPQKLHLDIGRYTASLHRLHQRVRDLRQVKRCPVCGQKTSDDRASFCTICGAATLLPGRVPEMIYQAIKLNENGKALICPHCDNEELTPGDYCVICGNDLINRCGDMPDPKNPELVVRSCRTVLPGNARYCSQCGNESTFYQKGWLKDWRSENTKKAIENINVANTTPVEYEEIKKDQKKKSV